MNILHVVGARPNFMKMAPVYTALKKYNVSQTIVHTGQHYSANMSDVFFRELKIKKPDVNLQIGSGTHAEQVAAIMVAFEGVILKRKPDMVVVYGDVNSTLAATLVCSKLGIPVAHVEAGLRSGDRSMPEEINRLVTDRLSTLYLTPSPEANIHLIREGIAKKNIHFVGNVMIDTLIRFLPEIKKRNLTISFAQFGVVTLHRPSNVDDQKELAKIIRSLNTIAKKIPLVFPVHPRTRNQLKKMKGVAFDSKNILLVDPLGYIDFLSLVARSALVITDSGGIQEETTYLKVPCLTLRANTERPITVKVGTNTLIGQDFKLLEKKVSAIMDGTYKKGSIPKKWDGRASERIASIIIKTLK